MGVIWCDHLDRHCGDTVPPACRQTLSRMPRITVVQPDRSFEQADYPKGSKYSHTTCSGLQRPSFNTTYFGPCGSVPALMPASQLSLEDWPGAENSKATFNDAWSEILMDRLKWPASTQSLDLKELAEKLGRYYSSDAE